MAMKVLARAGVSSEHLNGEEFVSQPLVPCGTSSCKPWFLAGWRPPSVPCHMGLSVGQLASSKSAKRWKFTVLCNINMGMASGHSCQIVLGVRITECHLSLHPTQCSGSWPWVLIGIIWDIKKHWWKAHLRGGLGTIGFKAPK